MTSTVGVEDLENVKKSYQSLQDEWKKGNLSVCGDLLRQLKVALTKVKFLPTDLDVSKKESLLARDILEIGALHSIAVKDIPSFERYLAQLKCYYFDHSKGLPESPYKYQLLGLNLMCLLAQNKLSEFHTELELLPVEKIVGDGDRYISLPVEMEQYLMEGSYQKVFWKKDLVPAESYNFFMDSLRDTTRQEIASCMEKAYEKLPMKEARRVLHLESDKELEEFSQKRGWVTGKDHCFHFTTLQVHSKHEESLNSISVARLAIGYAKEMEMIV